VGLSNWFYDTSTGAATRAARCGSFVGGAQIKWFYDTSTGAATGAARCGSFVGGAQIAQGVGYEGIRWTRGFTWFGPPERNTLRPRVNGVVLLCLSVRLKSQGPFLCVRSWRLPGPFIPQGRVVTVRPHGPTGGPGAGRPLRS
jgi:hypothetical protein